MGGGAAIAEGADEMWLREPMSSEEKSSQEKKDKKVLDKRMEQRTKWTREQEEQIENAWLGTRNQPLESASGISADESSTRTHPRTPRYQAIFGATADDPRAADRRNAFFSPTSPLEGTVSGATPQGGRAHENEPVDLTLRADHRPYAGGDGERVPRAIREPRLP